MKKLFPFIVVLLLAVSVFAVQWTPSGLQLSDFPPPLPPPPPPPDRQIITPSGVFTEHVPVEPNCPCGNSLPVELRDRPWRCRVGECFKKPSSGFGSFFKSLVGRNEFTCRTSAFQNKDFDTSQPACQPSRAPSPPPSPRPAPAPSPTPVPQPSGGGLCCKNGVVHRAVGSVVTFVGGQCSTGSSPTGRVAWSPSGGVVAVSGMQAGGLFPSPVGGGLVAKKDAQESPQIVPQTGVVSPKVQLGLNCPCGQSMVVDRDKPWECASFRGAKTECFIKPSTRAGSGLLPQFTCRRSGFVSDGSAAPFKPSEKEIDTAQPVCVPPVTAAPAPPVAPGVQVLPACPVAVGAPPAPVPGVPPLLSQSDIELCESASSPFENIFGHPDCKGRCRVDELCKETQKQFPTKYIRCYRCAPKPVEPVLPPGLRREELPPPPFEKKPIFYPFGSTAQCRKVQTFAKEEPGAERCQNVCTQDQVCKPVDVCAGAAPRCRSGASSCPREQRVCPSPGVFVTCFNCEEKPRLLEVTKTTTKTTTQGPAVEHKFVIEAQIPSGSEAICAEASKQLKGVSVVLEGSCVLPCKLSGVTVPTGERVQCCICKT